MPRGSKSKTKNRTRDLDQIYDDCKPQNIRKRLLEATSFDEDKPALGAHFCLRCDKYFCDEYALKCHEKKKPHKRRLRELEVEPHSQIVADWAGNITPCKRRCPSKPPTDQNFPPQPTTPSSLATD